MPVRTVPKNYRSLTGLVPNTRTQSMTAFESSLERDFLLLLDFDPDVEFYEEQPVKITYHDDCGRHRTYTPDVFVRYRTNRLPAQHTPPHLCEVKYRDDLRQHWAAYRPKFRVAQRYARQRGWRFRVVTEKHVRTPYLENVKFLRSYQTIPINERYRTQFLNALSALEETDPASLLTATSQDRWQQAQMLPMLWQLIARREVGTDLAQPLTMQSRIWPQESR
jgi:TnsA endonuclease N terminal/TnsA endonuclease C terminal